MTTNNRMFSARLVVLCLIASGAACGGQGGIATLIAQDQFLVTLTDDGPPPIQPSGQVARARFGRLDMSVILARALTAGTILHLKLFESRDWRVVLDRPIENPSGQGWTGHIDGDGQTGRFTMQYLPDGHFSAILRPAR